MVGEVSCVRDYRACIYRGFDMTKSTNSRLDDLEELVATLQDDVKSGRLTPKQFQILETAIHVSESLGIIRRFVIGLASFLAAFAVIYNYWPWGGK